MQVNTAVVRLQHPSKYLFCVLKKKQSHTGLNVHFWVSYHFKKSSFLQAQHNTVNSL